MNLGRVKKRKKWWDEAGEYCLRRGTFWWVAAAAEFSLIHYSPHVFIGHYIEWFWWFCASWWGSGFIIGVEEWEGFLPENSRILEGNDLQCLVFKTTLNYHYLIYLFRLHRVVVSTFPLPSPNLNNQEVCRWGECTNPPCLLLTAIYNRLVLVLGNARNLNRVIMRQILS